MICYMYCEAICLTTKLDCMLSHWQALYNNPNSIRYAYVSSGGAPNKLSSGSLIGNGLDCTLKSSRLPNDTPSIVSSKLDRSTVSIKLSFVSWQLPPGPFGLWNTPGKSGLRPPGKSRQTALIIGMRMSCPSDIVHSRSAEPAEPPETLNVPTKKNTSPISPC